MRYLLMICTDEHAPFGEEDAAATMAQYAAFGEEMGTRGVLQGGERLRPTSEAVCVQVHDGRVVTTDGPFAETKEQIGGFCLIDCADLDEAIEVASKHPAAGYGTIEIRPMWP